MQRALHLYHKFALEIIRSSCFGGSSWTNVVRTGAATGIASTGVALGGSGRETLGVSITADQRGTINTLEAISGFTGGEVK